MSRPYPPHPPRSTRSEPAPDPTARRSGRRYAPRADRHQYDLPYGRPRDGAASTEVIEDHPAPNYGGDYGRDYDSNYDDVEDYDEYEYGDYDDFDAFDSRWKWVAGVAGAVLLVAVICTVIILGGGDSGSVSATVDAPAATTSAAPSTSAAPPEATSKVPVPSTSLPAETVTTITPSPTATVAPPPPVATPQAPVPAAAGTVTYQVTGTRAMIDLVTVIYTDAKGALQTDLNVALPWSKTVVLDPGVTLSSVTATSVTGQLNCSITDASGGTIALQTNNSMITTCTS